MSIGLIKKPRVLGCLLLIVSWAICSPSWAQTGPVGWWKLDEGTGTTTADASGNGHSGTLTNSPTWSTGRVGPGALSFNGGTSSVAISGSAPLANLYSGGLTVSAWINPSGSGGGGAGRIVDKDNNDTGWFLAMSGTTAVKFAADQFVTSNPSRTSSATITLNAWQHVLVTWDGSTNGANIHVYINGVLSDGSNVNGSGAADDDSAVPLTIGNRPVDNTRGFGGLIDEVRVYNRVLTSTEIQALADATAPSAPSGLTATAASSSQINLSWTASTDNVGVTGYLLERCQGASCTTFAQIATPTTTSYSDTGLTASTSYSYRVRATDANSNLSGYSGTASATTSASGGDTTPPTAPSGLTATAASSSQINLSWTASTDNVGVTGYKVERCQGASCTTFAQIATPTVTGYSDTGLTASTSYSYRVRATDAANNLSAYSNTASATTSGAAPIAYVQSKSTSQNNSSQSTITAAFSAAQTAGNFNVVAIGWGSATIGISSVTDTKGNTYTLAAGPTSVTSLGTVAIYYAKNIAAAAAGANTVTVTFPSGVPFPDLRIAEYSGISTVSPLDVTASSNGTGTLSSSGSATTTNANDLLIGSNWVASGTTGAGTGYTSRQISGWDGDILEDQIVSTTGAYSATAPISPGAAWIMQMAAFKGTGGGGDTIPPSPPTGLSAAALSTNQINLSWTASTDNVGVTGYVLERCTGATCTNFTQIATPTAASYSDPGLTPVTTYRYQVKAKDAASNFSAYSNIATTSTDLTGSYSTSVGYVYDEAGRLKTTTYANGASTAYALDPAGNRLMVTRTPGDTTPPTAPGTPTFGSIAGTSATASWTTATDNVAVTSYEYNFTGVSTDPWTSVGNNLSVSLTGLTCATHYTFYVRAKDGAGNASTSSSASFTTPDTCPPSAPGPLTFSFGAPGSVTINWGAATDNVGVTGYQWTVDNWTTVSTVGVVLSVTDNALRPGHNYTAQVRAVDMAGNTGPSVTGSFDTQPTIVGGLNVSSITPSSAFVSYSAATSDEPVTYEWSLSINGPWTSNGTALSFTLSGLAASTQYTVYVHAKAVQTGPMAAYTFTTLANYADNANMVVGLFSTPQLGGLASGYASGAMGSMVPTTLTGGETCVRFEDMIISFASQVSISGFSADPGAGWLVSAAALGVTQNGSSATYSYSSGTANWVWGAEFGFGSHNGQNVVVTVVHK